jgi:hypothetical protein
MIFFVFDIIGSMVLQKEWEFNLCQPTLLPKTTKEPQFNVATAALEKMNESENTISIQDSNYPKVWMINSNQQGSDRGKIIWYIKNIGATMKVRGFSDSKNSYGIVYFQ